MRSMRRMTGLVALFLILSSAGTGHAGIPGSEKRLAKQTAVDVQQGEDLKNQTLSKYERIEGTPFNKVMDDVFARLTRTPEVAAREMQYEIYLVRSDEANAFCLPGGKVFVFSGMTSVLREDPDLWAALLGHELAHAVRSHSYGQQKAEKRLGFASKLFGSIGRMIPGAGQADVVVKRAGQAAKLAKGLNFLSPFLMRKFSRTDESDADAQGMLYMAKAGFDPGAAVRLHEEFMTRFGDSSAMTTFLKTHPRSAVRIENLQSLLPTVRELAASTANAQPQEVPVSADEVDEEDVEGNEASGD